MSMASLDTSTIVEEEEEPSVIQRLQKVKAAVKKATQEALKHHGATNNSDPPFSVLENSDPNASFHLGMELFGQEVSSIERNVQEKLFQMEQELEGITDAVARGEGGIGAWNESLSDRSHSPTKTPEELREESEQLKIKIRFLKECSAARAFLDESISLSTPALAPNEEPNLVKAAQVLVKSKQAIQRAQEILEAQEEHAEDSHNSKSSSSSPAALQQLAAAYTILDAVRSASRRHKVDTMGQAVTLWHSCVSLTSNSLAVRDAQGLHVAYDVLETLAGGKNYSGDAAAAANTSTTTSSTTSTLELTLRKFTRTLHTDVFQPLLDELLLNGGGGGKPKAAAITFHETEDRGTSSSSLGFPTASTKGSVRRLEWSCQDDDDDDVVLESRSDQQQQAAPMLSHDAKSWEDTLSFIRRVTVFVADHVLLQRSSLCHFVALRLFGKPSAMPNALNLEALGLESCRLGDDDGLLLHPLLDAMEKTCIPRYLQASQMGQLRSMAEELGRFLDPFVMEIAAKNLLPMESQTRLSAFSSSFEQKYVDNRRCELLNEARDMLVSNDYHNTVVVGEDVHQNKEDEALGISDGMSVFKLHKASVSDTAFKLMGRCRQAMDEAVEQHATTEHSPLSLLPASLYRTAREMLDLFRAIIPVTHGHEVANVPRTAAVLHNDCVFLAHHCLTLGLEYKDKFPEAAPDDARGKLLRQTCVFVDMVPLFRDLADRSLGDMLDVQAKQLVELVGERITRMGEALKSNEILAEWSDAETAFSAALYHLRHLSQAWKPILSYDILNRSMCYLVDVTFTLFLDQVAKASDISQSACSFVYSLFQKATNDLQVLLDGNISGSRVWDRFSAVGRFMDMSIADIQVALANGIFRSVTVPELSRLVTSCFDDTPKRRSLLKTLAANQ